MIISEKCFYDHYSDGRRSPVLFDASDIYYDHRLLAGDTSSKIDEVLNTIESNRIMRKPVSTEEFLYLENILKLNLDNVIYSNTIGNKIRIIKLNENILDTGYRIMKFTSENVEHKPIRYISIFISADFCDDDKLSLIYDLAEYLTDDKLEDIGVKYNIIAPYRKTIVLSQYITPADVKFIVNYYSCIFEAIGCGNTFKEVLDNLSVNSFCRHYILDNDTMEEIFKYSLKVSRKEDSIDDFIDVCNLAFKKLLEVERS